MRDRSRIQARPLRPGYLGGIIDFLTQSSRVIGQFGRWAMDGWMRRMQLTANVIGDALKIHRTFLVREIAGQRRWETSLTTTAARIIRKAGATYLAAGRWARRRALYPLTSLTSRGATVGIFRIGRIRRRDCPSLEGVLAVHATTTNKRTQNDREGLIRWHAT